MTTSPILDYTAGDIIRKSLRKVRIIAVDQPIQSKDFANGLDALNDITKFWQSSGLHLWAETQAVVPLVTGQRLYFLGPGGDKAAKANTFVNTTLSSAAALAASTVILTSVDGIEGADAILTVDPVLSTQDWTAIDSATLTISSGLVITNVASTAGGASFDLETTIGNSYIIEYGYTLGTSTSATFTATDSAGTLATDTKSATGTFRLEFTARDTTTTFTASNDQSTTGLTSTVSALQYFDTDTGDFIGIAQDNDIRLWSKAVFVDTVALTVEIADELTNAAASGSTVFSYETAIERPLRILQAQFSENISASEIPVNMWSRAEYFDQSDKDSSGTVVQLYYSPQTTNGEAYVWQVASSIEQLLRFTYERPLFVNSAAADVPDIPSEWVLPLVWAIASELGPEYGLPLDRQSVLEGKAAISLEAVLGHDVERDSMFLQPDFT